LALARLDEVPAGPETVLLHHAFLTRERSAADPAAYLAANAAISDTVERAVRRLRPAGTVLMSSGAVTLGDDLAANPYGVLKRRDEERFAACVAGRLVTCRLFNLSGPYINKLDSYVLACLIADALAGRPLRLRATRPVWRSYVDVTDLMRLLLRLAETPGPNLRFDTAGAEAVEVGVLAERVRAVLGRPELAIERTWDPAAEPDRYVGDGAAMARLAAAHGVAFRPLDQQIEETAEYLGKGMTRPEA
jgi:nucleoside-diphosphate-sugar epimerase